MLGVYPDTRQADAGRRPHRRHIQQQRSGVHAATCGRDQRWDATGPRLMRKGHVTAQKCILNLGEPVTGWLHSGLLHVPRKLETPQDQNEPKSGIKFIFPDPELR